MIRFARGLSAALLLGLVGVQASPAAEAPKATAAAAASETYVIDRSHSYVGFQVRHFVSKVPGKFNAFTGSIVFDPKTLDALQATVDIDASSIDTDHEKRDNHLKSADFFDTENHPKITFKSTGVKVIDATHAKLSGDLVMRGVSKPVTLDVEVLGVMPTRGTEKRAGFEAKGRVNRKDFNILWNRMLDNGGAMLSDDVDLLIQVEAVKPGEEPKPAAPASQTPSATKG